MKDENQTAVPTHTFAYMAKLLLDKELLNFLNILRREDIKGAKLLELPFSKQVEIKRKIRSFLQKKSIPVHFTDVFSALLFEEIPKYPLSPTITIEAADQIVEDNYEILLIKDKDGNLVDKQEIVIKIHASISVDELIKFIEKKRELLDSLMIDLQLPQIPQVSRWKNIQLALVIISMKDEEYLSFPEISSKLTSYVERDKTITDFVSDVDNIKNVYYRYKKYLSSE